MGGPRHTRGVGGRQITPQPGQVQGREARGGPGGSRGARGARAGQGATGGQGIRGARGGQVNSAFFVWKGTLQGRRQNSAFSGRGPGVPRGVPKHLGFRVFLSDGVSEYSESWPCTWRHRQALGAVIRPLSNGTTHCPSSKGVSRCRV